MEIPSKFSILRSMAPLGLLTAALVSPPLRAAPAEPRFVGPKTCATALCHGGAGEARHQFSIWSKRDFHSGSYATLTTARSEQIARALGANDATTDQRCVACHAPFAGLPSERALERLDSRDGVSCESCHGAGESWLRSHTRTDYNHQLRVAAGQRDLRDLYGRANACVACHQNLDAPLLAAGHPELLFELDGQTLAEPRHWREQSSHHGAQAWFVGQAVALREMSAQAANGKAQAPGSAEQWNALLWLFRNLGDIDPAVPSASQLPLKNTKAPDALKIADAIARDAARIEWSDTLTLRCLNRLASVAGDFEQAGHTRATHTRRAERLVLGIDRLLASLDPATTKPLEPHVDRIFKLSQSALNFDPKTFAKELRAFQAKLNQAGLAP